MGENANAFCTSCHALRVIEEILSILVCIITLHYQKMVYICFDNRLIAVHRTNNLCADRTRRMLGIKPSVLSNYKSSNHSRVTAFVSSKDNVTYKRWRASGTTLVGICLK